MKQQIDRKSFTVVEILVVYISIGWSFVMLTDSNAFNKSQNFSEMESIVHHEWIIGVICLILAITKITGMLINSTRVRWIGLMLSTIFWIAISATFLMSSNGLDLNTGFIIYSAVSVMCLWTSKEVLIHERRS